MPHIRVRCRKCKADYHITSTDNMNCRKCESGMLVRVNSHFDRRIEKARKDYISDIVDYSYSDGREKQ